MSADFSKHPSDNGAEKPASLCASGPLPDPRLLDLLVCPLTKEPLLLDKAKLELISPTAGLAYPIRDGIPLMLEEEARLLDENEKAQYSPKNNRKNSKTKKEAL